MNGVLWMKVWSNSWSNGHNFMDSSRFPGRYPYDTGNLQRRGEIVFKIIPSGRKN
jgi:hypothetical protein